MINSSGIILTGTRDSRLSLAQTRQTIEQLKEVFPEIRFDIVPMSSPGDRDKTTDLRLTSGDFFTRDLDDAVLTGRIDCAIHSAKDLPEPLAAGLDLLYLPWAEDPRDVLILRQGQTVIPPAPRVGVSSVRREEYCKKRFPDAVIKSIRGNIEQRIEQLDRGDYDLLVMAAAGLNRLGLDQRISEYIPPTELPTPPGQGKLALTFREGDKRFKLIRSLFVKPVIFAGAGVGTANNATLGAVAALRHAEICFYDALCPDGLLGLLPSSAEKISVGKRMGKHSLRQAEISLLLADAARRGLAVVRLKGGDPGIFGRLAEETGLLDKYALPYRVLPGISSLNAATTGTGLLLTRRGSSRCFSVTTPRKSGSGAIEWPTAAERHDQPQVFFMATAGLPEICAHLRQDGYPDDLPVSVVFNAGDEDEKIITGTLDSIAGLVGSATSPGLVIAGRIADRRYLFRHHGALRGMRVLFAGSTTLQAKAAEIIRRYDGRPVIRPMISLNAAPDAAEKLRNMKADWLTVTSPSAAELLFSAAEASQFDLRHLPKLAVCGPGTAEPFMQRGIFPEICPEHDFGTIGLINELKARLAPDDTVVRLCSDLAEPLPFAMKNIVFYHNNTIHYDTVPEFDAVLFTSKSAVKAFAENFTPAALTDKLVCAIGNPTASALASLSVPMKILTGADASMEQLVYALAKHQVNRHITELNGDSSHVIS